MSPSTESIITTIVGTGATTYSVDNGAATSAGLYNPFGVAVDSSGTKPLATLIINERILTHSLGNVYIADSGNNCIRKVTASTGIITTIAGTGASTYSGDGGAATSAGLYDPLGVALDSSGTF